MKRKSIVTFTNIVILLAIIVYILNIFVVSPDTGSTAESLIHDYQENGEEITQDDIFIFKCIGIWGGHLNDLLGHGYKEVLSGQLWRIYTVVVTHAHIAHIIMNLIALFIAGNHIERKYGTPKMILLFLVLTALNCLIADLLYFGFLGSEYKISMGASGWIASVMGMILTKCLQDRTYCRKELGRAAAGYLIVYFISTTFLIMPNAFTIIAHVSGLVCGALAEYVISRRQPGKGRPAEG